MALHPVSLNLTWLQSYSSRRPAVQLSNMSTPETCNATKRKKTKVKPKKGSQRYLHLLNFIERRREKKLKKRRTLDPTAQVIFSSDRSFLRCDAADINDDGVVMMLMICC